MTEPLIVTSLDTLRVLLIDDDRAILEAIDAILKAAGVGGVVKALGALSAFNRMPALKAPEVYAAVSLPSQA